MDTDRPIDNQVAALAARQRGHITRPQLLSLGVGAQAIIYRLRIGRLHRVYPGVYAVGHRRTAPIDLAMAAVLACGPEAVLSDLSAAALWGFVDQWPERPEVTVLGDRRPRGIRTHRRALTRADRRRHLGIPVTSPARTVLDCAPRLGPRLTRFVNDALLSKWLSAGQLAPALQGRPPGVACVREILEGQHGITRSDMEDRFVALCAEYRLPQPELNVVVNGREVDAFFRAEGVIVELDSWRFHSDRQSFEADRDKDAEALAEDLLTVRPTWRRLTVEAEQEADRLKTILSLRRKAR